jgi:hypothetical protein
VIVLVAVAGGAGLTEATGVTRLTASVIHLLTGEGALVIEVDDPRVSVAVDGQELVISGAGPREVRQVYGLRFISRWVVHVARQT